MSTTELIKVLREKCGAGMMDCKRALAECDNDIEKAAEHLRKKGILKMRVGLGRRVVLGKLLKTLEI